MLPAAARLRRSDEFATAIRRGRRTRRGHLVVHLGQDPLGPAESVDVVSAPGARVGFVVSKAVGGAVVRNQVTRRLRHLMRERLDRCPSGSLVVIRALPGAGRDPFARLAADLDSGLSRVLQAAPSSQDAGSRVSSSS